MGIREIICLSFLVACASAQYYQSCPTLFGFYPDSSDCTKFYRCNWGKPIRFSCGVGTRWSQGLLTCDYARNVPCGGYNGAVAPNNYNQHQTVYPNGNNYNNNNNYNTYPNSRSAHSGVYHPQVAATHTVQPAYVPVVHNTHSSDPDYYQYVNNYKYGGDAYANQAPYHK